MADPRFFNGCWVSPETTIFKLLESKDPADHKKAKRLSDYCNKAYFACYDPKEITKLRNEYKDVL